MNSLIQSYRDRSAYIENGRTEYGEACECFSGARSHAGTLSAGVTTKCCSHNTAAVVAVGRYIFSNVRTNNQYDLRNRGDKSDTYECR